jgi:hypothetical protein
MYHHAASPAWTAELLIRAPGLQKNNKKTFQAFTYPFGYATVLLDRGRKAIK